MGSQIRPSTAHPCSALDSPQSFRGGGPLAEPVGAAAPQVPSTPTRRRPRRTAGSRPSSIKLCYCLSLVPVSGESQRLAFPLPSFLRPQHPPPTPKRTATRPVREDRGQRRPSAVRGLQARRRWGLQTRPQHGVARHAGAHLRGRRAVLAALGGRRWSIFPARGHSQRAPSPGPPRPRPGRRGERRATREPEPSPAEPRPLPSHPPPAAALKATESRFPRADSAPGPRRALGAGPLTPGQVDKEPPGPRSRGAARLGTPTLDSRGCSGAGPPRPFGTEDAERRRGRGGRILRSRGAAGPGSLPSEPEVQRGGRRPPPGHSAADPWDASRGPSVVLHAQRGCEQRGISRSLLAWPEPRFLPAPSLGPFPGF